MQDYMKVSWCIPEPRELPRDLNQIYWAGELVSGKIVSKFEEALQTKFKTKREFVCVNNGTSALQLLLMLHADSGTDLYVPANAFIAIRNVCQMLGIDAHPVDVDEFGCIRPWESDTLGLVIDFAGCPANYDALKEYDCKFIVDGCESIGTLWREKPTWDQGLDRKSVV